MMNRNRILLIAAVASLLVLSSAGGRAPANAGHVDARQFLQAVRWCRQQFGPGPAQARCIVKAWFGVGPYYEYGPGAPTQTPTATMPPTPTATPAASACASRPDGTTCDAGIDSQVPLICVAGACVTCLADAAAAPRFVDNGDGTITDRLTCLVWEKKDDSGSIHDKDDTYTWCNAPILGVGFPPNGTAFTVFLPGLNSMGFAGHHDWRLPTAAGYPSDPTGHPAEAESLWNPTVPGCSISPISCIDPSFDSNCGEGSNGNEGCTIDGAGGTEECSCSPFFNSWWTASSFPSSPNGGAVYSGVYRSLSYNLATSYKLDPYSARAVRGGLVVSE